MIAWITEKLASAKAAMIAIGAGLVGLALIFFRVRQDGANAAKLEQAEANETAILERKQSDKAIARMPADRKRDALGRWVRNDG